MVSPSAQRPDRNLAMELVRVTESAALAAARWVGRGHKEGADAAAVDAMRLSLSTVQMTGTVIIGEGEKDDAPMLYNGEVVGDGTEPLVDVAVDPIDGTKAFTKGVPLYATLIALIDDHGPAVGVIHLPALGETIAAGRGLGCTFNGAPCRVSGHDTLDGAYATTSGFGYWPSAALQRLLDSDVVFRTWGDAYGYALVATGRAEAMIDPLANPWDIAPMAVIIPEAGGRFSNFDGVEQPNSWNRNSGVATNGLIHDDLIGLFTD